MCALVLFIFILQRWKINKSIIEPGIIFALNLILLYPVRAVVLYAYGSDALPDYYGAENTEEIEASIWVATLGCIGFVFGYNFIIGRQKLNIIKDHSKTKWKEEDIIAVAVLFFLSLVGVAYKIATGDYISYLLGEDRNSGVTQIINILTSLQWPAYIGAWILWFKECRDGRFIILFSLIIAIVVPYQFIQGSKTFLSLLIVSMVIAYYWTTGKTPRLIAVIGIFVVMTFVFPFVQNFREYINSGYGKIPSFSELNFREIERAISDRTTDDNGDAAGFFKLSARYGGIDHLYGIMQTVPYLIEYRYGLEYGALFVNIIPRAVWPDKPIYSRGADYGKALGTTTSITPFPIGEAYWDLGKFGVPLMMGLWGGCLALVIKGYEYLGRKKMSKMLLTTYFLSQIYWISGGETYMPMVLGGIPQQLVIIFAANFLIQNTKKFVTKNRGP